MLFYSSEKFYIFILFLQFQHKTVTFFMLQQSSIFKKLKYIGQKQLLHAEVSKIYNSSVKVFPQATKLS